MTGTFDSDFNITNIEDLHYVNGEENDYTSLSGTPAAGRRLKYNDYSASLTHSGDNACYGEAGVACTGNLGIVIEAASSDAFTFVSGETVPATWFAANSYLGTTSALTADPDADIWP